MFEFFFFNIYEVYGKGFHVFKNVYIYFSLAFLTL